jgi:hypothetical protein
MGVRFTSINRLSSHDLGWLFRAKQQTRNRLRPDAPGDRHPSMSQMDVSKEGEMEAEQQRCVSSWRRLEMGSWTTPAGVR